MEEFDPVNERESLLRRIPNQPSHYDSKQHLPITRVAFEPSQKDTDGISVFRELFSSASQVAQGARTPNDCYVASIYARRFFSLDLSVVPDPDPNQPRGHALVREIHTKMDKKLRKELGKKLADIASENIVFSPPSIIQLK